MRPINLIVIHCAASPNGKSLFQGLADGTGLQKTPVEVIDDWHRERGFHRDHEARQRFNPRLTSIGYHHVIYTNGAVVSGRHHDEIGAHVEGFNQKSIGVCMVGTDHFTADQWRSLVELVKALQTMYPGAAIHGHREMPNVHKECPGFDVATWLAGGMAALTDHLIGEG